jgi:hypothetical protein
MVVMWDGDALSYVEILKKGFPIVKRILENPEVKI